MWDTDGSPKGRPSLSSTINQSRLPVEHSIKVPNEQQQLKQFDGSKNIQDIIVLQQQGFMQMMGMMNEAVKSIAMIAAHIQNTASASVHAVPSPSIEPLQQAATAMHLAAGEPLQQAAAALQMVAAKMKSKDEQITIHLR